MPKKKAKKVVVKKAAPKAVFKKPAAINKPYTKSLLVGHIAGAAALRRADAAKCIETIGEVIELHLKKRGPGEFVFPGLMKFRTINKPATKARQGINPFTGEPTTFAAKPARTIVKIRPLKKLKDMVR